MVEEETQIKKKNSKTEDYKNDSEYNKFAKDHKEDERSGLRKNSKISIKQTKALKWINSCLKTSYESFEDLKDGKAIRELLDISIYGVGVGWQHECHVWSDIDMQLDQAALSNQIDLEMLRNVQQSEVCKLIRKIRTKVEKALEEAKYKDKENSTSVRKKCNGIQK